ncbi:hypothetical protein GOBAR_AA05770 [Gossypium barbadense]|uniref:Uncharacterized protein n=1 Tax=Gossypium barbadense TaxID=3634 RepID=A0A2P5YH05_GOSBA|nr:hypothetical protein GOBAR_AA05770 [Gossypium barbadense]
MTVHEASNSSEWSREQDKAFENALATYPEDTSYRWEKIAADVRGKTLEEIKQHYELLEDDVNRIESGCVPLPAYSSSEGSTCHAGDEVTSKKGSDHLGHFNSESDHGSKNSRSDQERRKGIAWTEDEHREAAIRFGNLKDIWGKKNLVEERINVEVNCNCSRLFLLGLDKYGKGDWRSISRDFVVTRTPTQVASHAQKYFIRLNSINKDRRRSSIHDITSVGNGEILATQGPITGELNGAATGCSSAKSAKQPSQHPAASPGVGTYSSPTIGQPIGGPLVSTVGTSVNLPAPPHLAYGAVVPSAPMNMGPVKYSMPHKSDHR